MSNRSPILSQWVQNDRRGEHLRKEITMLDNEINAVAALGRSLAELVENWRLEKVLRYYELHAEYDEIQARQRKMRENPMPPPFETEIVPGGVLG